MRYLELTIENFRVFGGEQTLRFPEPPGVIIVYGMNGKGKTSLLNAFRWVWTGTARHRGNRQVPDERLINREALTAAGTDPATCRVHLRFETDGVAWDLTRTLTSQGGSLSKDVTLLRDGVALTASDTTRRLAELMPRDIEQFFMFDGELLDQYEKLVDDDAAAGAMLRDSIERILGVPVVVNAERDVRGLAESAARAIAEAAKRSTRTRELGQALEQTQTRAAAHRSNRDAEDARITELEAELRAIEELQASQQNKIELLARRDEKRSQVARLRQQLDEARDRFGQAFATSWRGVLVEPVTAAVDSLEETLVEDQELLANATVAAVLSATYRDNGQEACPACDTPLDEEHRAHLTKVIDMEGGEQIEVIRDRVQTTAERVRTLRKIIDEQARVEVSTHESAYRRAQIQVEDAAEELAALEEQLKDVGEGDELSGLAARRDQVTLALAKSRDIRDVEERNRAEAADRVERLRKQIQSTGGGDADEATVRREQLTRDLATLFDRAVVEYRDRLRESVQESASSLFRSMRAESDFRKLVINDRYGLRILDSKGQIVEDRSAGYEHLVALSLLGALQECSPISGPIVMDSPFGRLDPDHVRRVVGQLNALADQVFLLVHEGEIDRWEAQDQLRSRLLAQYELRRLSAYNTRIEELSS